MHLRIVYQCVCILVRKTRPCRTPADLWNVLPTGQVARHLRRGAASRSNYCIDGLGLQQLTKLFEGLLCCAARIGPLVLYCMVWEQSVVGIVAPSSPGVVHTHRKLPLRMGAPSLDGHERQPQHDSNSVMSEGKQNQWELSSFAHAHTFRDSLKSPMKRADSTKRVSFMHRSNMSSLPMSIL